MSQSDLDELTGRTIDGVSRAARYLAIAGRGLSACSPAELDEIYLLWEAMGEEERDDVRRVSAARNAENAAHDAALPRPVETQASISTWAEATFGPSGSNARAVARANREMSELLEHVTADDRHPEAAEEVADIVIVLYRVATRLGVDLHERIDRKMATNRARKWQLDGTGHGYHVVESAESAALTAKGDAGIEAAVTAAKQFLVDRPGHAPIECSCYGCTIGRQRAGIPARDRSAEPCSPPGACASHGRCWIHSEWVDEARCDPPGACATAARCATHAEGRS